MLLASSLSFSKELRMTDVLQLITINLGALQKLIMLETLSVVIGVIVAAIVLEWVKKLFVLLKTLK